MFSEAWASPAPEPEPEPAQAPRGADAETAIAAIDRMDSALRKDRAALDRLRVQLQAMAEAVAQAKAEWQPSAMKPDAAAQGKALHGLLDELEHRIDAMIEVTGAGEAPRPQSPLAGTPAPASEGPAAVVPAVAAAATMTATGEPQGAPARVPTVSDVVSRLGRPGESPAPADEERPAVDTATADVPTVSMLEAMVEALTSAPADRGARRQGEPPDLQFVEPPSPDPAEPAATSASAAADIQFVDPDTEPAVPQGDATAVRMQESVAAQDIQFVEHETPPAGAEPQPLPPSLPPPSIAPAAAPPQPQRPTLQEDDLLASFAQMEAFPFLPPEDVGTAVIFGRRETELGSSPAPPPRGPDATSVSEPSAQIEPSAILELQPEQMLPDEERFTEPARHAPVAPQPETGAATGGRILAAAPDEAETDPAAFLYDVDGEESQPAEPAASLLEPLPPQPQPATSASPAPGLRTSTPPDNAIEPADEEPSTQEPAPNADHDPLAPLKAMTDEERIALFS